MQPRNRRRVLWALAASAVIHLLLLAAYVRMADWYRRQDLRPTRYLPDLLLLAPSLFRQDTSLRIPERLVERTETAPEATPLPAPELPMPAPVSTEHAGPATALDSLQLGAPPLVFIGQPELSDVHVDELQIEAVRQLREQYDTYARFWVADADTTDAEGRARTRAEAIVARAFEAMGGLDQLLQITQMRVVVWVIANETVLPAGTVRRVSPYPYPIGFWHMHGFDRTDKEAFRVDYDLSADADIPEWVFRNPAHTRRRYYASFDGRWLRSAPPTTREERMHAETARWHFADWFLGEGIRLSYLGSGRLEAQDMGRIHAEPVDRIRVDDRKYGRVLEAYFQRQTGLLVGTREAMLPAESKWYLHRYESYAPVWTTRYDDYCEVAGVLLPHRWYRSSTSGLHADVRFNIAVNEAYPDTVPPVP